MTAEQALAALKNGDPIHVQGDEMQRFIAAVFTRRQRKVWEASHNSHLGCTPLEALSAGRVAEVEQAARAFDAGAYA